jgi:DNA polymerase III sliding clamp (beta) subunit (PCNA family)
VKLTTIKAGVLKDALKKAITSANAETATITVGAECHVEVSGHEGYSKVDFQAENMGAAGTATVSASVANHVMAGVARDESVTFEPNKEGLTMRFGGARLKLKRSDEEGNLFDDSKLKLEKQLLFRATGAELLSAFKAATDFAAKKDIRYYLCGVQMAQKDGVLIATATNGFSLHRLNTGIAVAEGAMESGLIIPTRAAESIRAVFSADELVTVNLLGTGLMQFSTDSMNWVSNLVTGQFPNCDAVLREESSKATKVRVGKKDLVLALQRIQAISGDRYSHVILDAENVVVQSIDKEQVVRVPSKACEGVLVSLGVTMTLLIEALEAVPTETVQIATVGPEAKLFIRPVTGEDTVDDNWVATLTPARV